MIYSFINENKIGNLVTAKPVFRPVQLLKNLNVDDSGAITVSNQSINMNKEIGLITKISFFSCGTFALVTIPSGSGWCWISLVEELK